MIAKIIPFFLLAYVPEKVPWQNEAEFKFTCVAQTKVSGINGTTSYGLNVTNELLCRPKEEHSLRCLFRHISSTIYEFDLENDSIKSREMSPEEAALYDPFHFDIEFDKRGVNKLVINQNLTNYPQAKIAASVANLLNVDADLGSLNFDDNIKSQELNSMGDFLIGKCPAYYEIQYTEGPENAKDGIWNLETAPPLGKLEGQQFEVKKMWNLTDCRFQTFYWLQIIVSDIQDDEHLKITDLAGEMLVQRGSLKSATGLLAYREHENRNISLSESLSMTLDDVRPALGEWPSIDDPVTTVFQGSEEDNESS